MDNLPPVNSSSIPLSDLSSFFGAMGGNGAAFGDVFSQALSQAKNPADAAKIDWLQAEYSNLVDLSSMGSGSSSGSLGGLGMGDLFGAGGSLSLPSWTQDAANLLGNDSIAQQALSAQQMAAFQLQSQFNQSLANFGSTGSSVDSLI